MRVQSFGHLLGIIGLLWAVHAHVEAVLASMYTPCVLVRPLSPERASLWLQACDEEKLLGHLGVVLYEYLGEEYPEVLGSILGALKSIVNVIGMTKMTPPIKDLLPRLTPILKNRHEKVRNLPVPPLKHLLNVILCDLTSETQHLLQTSMDGSWHPKTMRISIVALHGGKQKHRAQQPPTAGSAWCRCRRTASIWWGALPTAARSMCRRASGCASALSSWRCSRRTRRASAAPPSTPSATLPRPSGPRCGHLITLSSTHKSQQAVAVFSRLFLVTS